MISFKEHLNETKQELKKTANRIEKEIIRISRQFNKTKKYEVEYLDTDFSNLSQSRYLKFNIKWNWDEYEYVIGRGSRKGEIEKAADWEDIGNFYVRISDHDLPPSYANRNRGELKFGIGIGGYIGQDTHVSTDDPKTAGKEFQKWLSKEIRELS